MFESSPLRLLFLVGIALFFQSTCRAATVEIQYSGNLREVSRNGDSPAPVKQFDVYALLRPAETGHECFHVVTERGGGSWAWPERFGRASMNDSNRRTSGRPPHVLHEHDGVRYPIELPLPLFEFADKLAAEATWKAGRNEYSVRRQTTVGGQDCWQVDATDNFGRRQSFIVAQDDGAVLAAERRVFMGRGEEFILSVSANGVRDLTAKESAEVELATTALLGLQSSLERTEGTTKSELSPVQINKASKALPDLLSKTERLPLKSLVVAIARDVKAQSQRAGDVSSLEKKFVGQPLPGFVLPMLDGKQLDSASLQGKITVLHFWEYQSEPLEEPYGQVGYLDFLLNRRGRLGVQAYGIAVSEAFIKPLELGAAKRSVRKLRDFMNIGYPIALDGGQVIRSLGDPRQLDASLPLWVVVGPEGKIADYHVGVYPINPNEGLRELDAVVVRLIREQRDASE